MEIKELLKEKEFIIFDGAMGTQLQAKGLKTGETPELLNLTEPELLKEIHTAYINAGADIVSANTFGANRYKLEHCGKSVNEIISAGIKNLKDAINKSGKKVYAALDIGPIGQLLEPTGSLSFEEAYDIFKEEIIAGRDAGADVVLFETMTDLYEMKAAILAAKENCELPVICSMTYEPDMRTFAGCPPLAQILLCEGLGADAVGVNCSLGPNELMPIVEEICNNTRLPVIVMPNAGLPDPETGAYHITAEEFAECTVKMAGLGVSIIGGCCGTTPEFIKAVADKLQGVKRVNKTVNRESAVCSGTKTVIIDSPKIIGERINPTGKKLFKQALINDDINYILGQAIEQVHAGAEILDVNVGLPDINEEEMMIKAVKNIQSVTDAPLQLDSTIPAALSSALRIYNGKPIVNSVNGEEESLNTILPIVKKYGAAVVGLTLDKEGIPKKAEQRFEIAKRIVKRATDIGIPKEDIYIDCLTLTASAEQEAVRQTLKAVRMVKEQLGVKTVLGVSNISFGLPNRELLNHIFLTMALENGLDLPIINPNVPSMTGAVRAFRLLSNIDVNSKEYIAAYSEVQGNSAPVTQKQEITIGYCIENGLKEEAAKLTKQLLQTMDSMEIVNTMLIPALDKAGKEFETGKIFLPQLILAAGVAQSCFDVIKAHISATSQSPVSKGKIVLATVKGDIHDIGKNIVKVLLENYGYTVIDLGKDVDYQAVVDAAVKHEVKLVGLSALMTTTLKSMEETIKLIRANNLPCKIVVGGAVLTPEYAEKIGADFYAKDAKETVDIAKKVIG